MSLSRLRRARALASALGTVLGTALGGRDPRPRVVLDVGDPAPDFVLGASDGCTYRLSALCGASAVVLAWFPKAFTTGCTAECSAIGLSRSMLAGFEVSVLAACCDDPETCRAFAESTGIGVPILSDPDRQTARAYGVLGSIGLPDRWTFYIGMDGRILRVDRSVRTGTHGADVVSALQDLGVPRRA